MTSRRDRITALLLSVMMIALNLFSGTEALYAYADNDADSQTITEEAAGTEQAEDTADAEEEEQAETPKEEAAPAEEAAKEEAAPVEQAKEEAEEEVAFSDEEKFNGVSIKVTADKGVFPEGAEIEVRDLTAKEEKKAETAIDKIDDDDADIAKEYLFDISVQKDGKEIEPNGDVKVSFETDEIADDGLKAEVFHVKDNGVAEELAVETKGETATVETDSFSPYSLRFINANEQSLEYDLVMNGGVWLSDILDAIGMESRHYDIDTATAPSAVVSLTHENRTRTDYPDYEDYWVSATGYNLNGDHALEVHFHNYSNIVILIKTHVHNWNLHTEGGTAMLECTAEGCPHPQYTWTLTASDVTYDGNPHYANLSAPELKGNDVNVSSIVYYSGTSTTPMTGYPVNAGDYRAVVTIDPDNGTHEDARTISASFRINKAEITVTAPAAIPNLVYGRTWQNLHNAGSAKSATTSQTFTMMYAKGTETEATETYAAAIEQGFNAGDYWIWYYVAGDSNHNASAPAKIKASIAKKSVVVQNITGINKVYDGTDAASVNTDNATFSGKYDGDKLTINANGSKFRSTDAEGKNGKNVGDNKAIDLTLTFGGEDAGNYTFDAVNSQNTARADITKKDVEASWDEATKLQYTGDYQAPIADLMVTEVINDNDKKIYKVDEGKVSVTVEGKQKNVGKGYKAYVGVLEGDEAGNYNLINKTTPAEFSIVPKKLTANWANTTQEYDAKGLKPVVVLTGFVNDEGELVKHIADTMTIEAVAPTELVGGEAYNAGKYIATVALEDAEGVEPEQSVIGNYELTNPTSDFTITKAPLTVKAKGWVYYGTHTSKTDSEWINELEYEIPDKTQFKGDDGVEVIKAMEDKTARFDTDYDFLDPATGVNEATYYLYPEFGTADNYEITNEDGELTVYPKPVVLEWTHEHAGKTEAVSGDQVFTYDAKFHKYTAEVSEDSYVKTPDGMPASPKMTVTVQANIQSDANVKTGTEKYTAYAAELSNPNYALVEISKDGTRTPSYVETRDQDFIINQRPVELSWTPSTFTYNAKDQRPTVKVANLQTNDNGDKDAAFVVKFNVEAKDDSDIISISAGDYTAKAINEETGYLADKNYSLLATPTDPMSEFVSSSKFDYTINKAPLYIQPKAKTISYKDAAPTAYDNVVSGLKGDDTEASIGLDKSSLKFKCSYRKNDKPGTYTVVPSIDAQNLDNYKIVLKNGNLKVNDKVTGLVAQAKAKGKKKAVLSWNGVTGATSYEVWMSKCDAKGKHRVCKKVATVKGKTYKTKKLKKKSFYKFYIVANTPNGKIKSSESHFTTGNKSGKFTNAKSLKLNKSSVTLNKGGKYKIAKTVKKAKKKLKLPGKYHGGNYRFESDNTAVAKVDSSGTITAVGSGWCRIYTQTTNGIWQVTQVYVK